MEPVHTEHTTVAPRPTPAPAARPAPAVAPARSPQDIIREQALNQKTPIILGAQGFKLVMLLLTAFAAGYAFHWWNVRQFAEQAKEQTVIEQLNAALRDATNQIQAFRQPPAEPSPATNKVEKEKPAAPIAPEEKATILGVVRNEKGEPIVGAKVRLDGASVRTRSNGTFSFPLFADEAELEIVAAGYLAAEQTVKASAPDVTVILSTGKAEPKKDLPLQPPPVQPPSPAPEEKLSK